MKQDLNEEREKEIISLIKERDELQDIINASPWRKLEEPIHSGWYVNFRLTKEALNRSDGERMERALAMCSDNFILDNSNAGKISKLRKDKSIPKMRMYFYHTGYDGKVYYHGPDLKPLKEKEFSKLDEGMRKFFDERVKISTSNWGGQKFTTKTYHLNIPEYYINIHIEKRMLTLVQEVDSKILQRKAFVDNKLHPYYLSMPGSSHKYWKNMSWSTKKMRRHMKDAINKTKVGELSSPYDYRKIKGKK